MQEKFACFSIVPGYGISIIRSTDYINIASVLQVEECEVGEVCVDQDNRLVTTPAFMFEATFCQVKDTFLFQTPTLFLGG